MEGNDALLPNDNVAQCRLCSETCRSINANPPQKFEEHYFVALLRDNAMRRRVDLVSFRKELLEALPMTMTFEGFWYDSVLWGRIWTVSYQSSKSSRLKL